MRILDRAGFERLHGRDPRLDRLSLNHLSDYARAWLLAHFGGLYLDLDCIVVRSLTPVLDAAERHGFVGYREPQGYMSCNFMAAVPESPVIRDHFARVSARIDDPAPLAWLDLASVPMDAAMASHAAEAALLHGEDVMPLAWNDSILLAERRSEAEHAARFRKGCWCYMLANHTIQRLPETRALLALDPPTLLESDSFLGFLLREGRRRAPRRETLMSGGITLARPLAPPMTIRAV